MLIDTVLIQHAFHAEWGCSVFRLYLNQLGGIAKGISLLVQYVACELRQGHLEPLCVGFKDFVELCGCIRFHCQITLLVISYACFNFCWATCVPEHYAAI